MIKYLYVFVALIASGYYLGYSYEKGKQDKVLIQELEEQIKLTKKFEEISNENYKLYKDAINRPPTVVTDRVYVSAKCPENQSGSLGDGRVESRAELHPETVRRVTEVTDMAEVDVLKCQAIVSSLREKITTFNKLGENK